MKAVWMWVRVDLRRRARSLTLMALLVALTTGVVLTAVAGARRGATVVDRLLAETKPATVAALPNQPGFDWEAVAALPGVEAVGRFAVSTYAIDDLPPAEGGDFPYLDAAVMDEVERPVVLEGRLFDPARDDEAVITPVFRDTYGKGVGDTVTLRLYTPEQIDALYSSAEELAPEGPTIETRIVGVVRSGWFSDSGGGEGGRLVPSPGLFQAHAANLLGAQETVSVNALIRLDGGEAAVPAFREQLAEVSGRRDIDFMNLAAEADHVEEVVGFEADALLVFALAAFIAALFLVGQSVARFVSGVTQDLQVLLAVGMSPRHVRVAAAAGPALASIGGAVVGVGVAVVASSRFPIGTATPYEPDPGWYVDLTVLGIGLVVIPLLVVVGAVLASGHAARPLLVDGAGRRSRIAGLMARAGAPVPVTLGTSFALDRGRGAQAVPVYPALVGAVVGVLGVIAALTFAAGVSDATAHPERFGQVAQAQSFVGFNDQDFVPADDLLAALADDPDVVAVNDTRQGVLESGTVDIPAFSLDPLDELLPIILTEGRAPTGAREVTLAPESVDALGVELGDTVELAGSRSTGSYTVSGIAFVPEGSHNAYDSGAWLPADTYDELIDGFKFRTVDIVFRPGADRDAVATRVAVAMGVPELADEVLGPMMPPTRLAELQQIQRLPLFLAAFLALLAIAAVGHALATAVRRRRHDLAVLRALGATRPQSRASVLVQAAVLALVGLTLGVPLGLALGRTLWRSVADTTPIDHVPPVALWALVLIGPAVLLGAALLAAWPSQRAASLRVAHVLRTE